MAEHSFAREVPDLQLGVGEAFRNETVLAGAKGLAAIRRRHRWRQSAIDNFPSDRCTAGAEGAMAAYHDVPACGAQRLPNGNSDILIDLKQVTTGGK